MNIYFSLLRRNLGGACCFVLLTNCGVASALNLKEVVDLTLKNNLTLIASQFELESTQEKVPQALAAFLPSISATSLSNRLDGKVSFFGDPYTKRQYPTDSWWLKLTLPIIQPQNWIQYHQVEVNVDAADIRHKILENEQLLKTCQTYFDLINARNALFLAKSEQGLLEAQRAAVVNAKTMGSADDMDVSAAEIAKARANIQVLNAEIDYRNKVSLLAKIIRTEVTQIAILEEPKAEHIRLYGADDIAIALQTSLDVQLKTLNLKVAQAEPYKQFSAHLPTLDFVATRTKQREGGNIDLPITAETVTYSTIVGLQLNIPLFEGGATQSKVRESVAAKMKAQAELDSAQADLDQFRQSTTRSLLIGTEHMRIILTSLRSASANIQATDAAFKIGLKKEADLLSARHQLTTLTYDLYRTCYENMMQWLQLQALDGTHLIDAIDGINAQLTATVTLDGSVGAAK